MFTAILHRHAPAHRSHSAALIALLLLMLLMLASPLFGQKPAGKTSVDQCISCHIKSDQDEDVSAPAHRIKDDIHQRFGLSCADCHGGDRTATDASVAMSASAGFVGSPATDEVPRFCGRCHSDASMMKKYNPTIRVDQESEYATSVHGKRLSEGDTKVATCISCHGVHGIRAVNDAKAPVYPLNVAKTCGSCHADSKLMAPYGIPTNQMELYSKSVHAEALIKKQDLSAPTCNDCHGNHGAAPPGVASVAYVCGSCHARQSELFEQSPHKTPFEESNLAGCVQCHSNHQIKHPNDNFLGVSAGAVCLKCHDEGEDAYKVAAAMRADLLKLSTHIDSTTSLLSRAANAGMEVSKPQFELKDARDKLINARVMIHLFSKDTLDTLIDDGLATTMKAHNAGEQAMSDLDFRRKGLAASLIVIIIAAASIYLKVRQMER